MGGRRRPAHTLKHILSAGMKKAGLWVVVAQFGATDTLMQRCRHLTHLKNLERVYDKLEKVVL